MRRFNKILWLIIFAFLTTSCVRIGWWFFSPNPIDFPLSKDFFPEARYVGHIHDYRDGDPSQESSSQQIFFTDGITLGADYDVNEFRYSYQAEERFEGFEYGWIEKDKYETISGEIEWADRYYLACGYDLGKNKQCVFGGKYQHFLFFFRSNIGDFFTLEEFLDVVYYIDEMAGEGIMQ
jgi:hypothetical protein